MLYYVSFVFFQQKTASEVGIRDWSSDVCSSDLVQKLVARVVDRRILTYGLNPQADVRAANIRAENGMMVYDVTVATRANGPARTIEGLRLPMLGEHNVQNELVMVAIAHQLGIPDAVLRKATAGFSGVRRRFTRKGESDGIIVIDEDRNSVVQGKSVTSRVERRGSRIVK